MMAATRKLSMAVFFFTAFVPNAQAQIGDIDRVLEGGVEDANILLRKYAEPLAIGFGAGLNSGWISAPAPHKPLGFHVRVGASVAMVPGSDRAFTVTDEELSTLRVVNPEIRESPTASGVDDAATYIFETVERHPETGEALAQFEMPSGTGYPYVPAPEIQLGVGLVRNTSVMLRFVPSLEFEEFGSVGMFGAGVQHGLNQWIPGGKLLPVDLAVQLGFTRFGMNVNLNESDGRGSSDQELDWNANAFAMNVVAGKSLPIISGYAGLGWETSSSDIALKGTYEIETETGTEQVKDPIALNFNGANGLHALAGMRLRLFVLTINAEYTLARYPSLNAGIGFSLR
jgi:hypothetical protein